MSNIQTVVTALESMLAGDPCPSFKSPEASALLQAMGALEFPLEHGKLGAQVMQAMIARLRASVEAERDLAMLRDGSRLS